MLLERWMLLWLLAFSGTAFFWPSQYLDIFLLSGPYQRPLFALTMGCIGFMLPTAEVNDTLKGFRSVALGVTAQYTIMPLLAFGLAMLPGLPEQVRLGLILVGCVPGAMASNVLTLQAGGNTSFSVGLTTLATILSPIAVPLALGLAIGKWDEETFALLAKSSFWLLVTVVVPVIVGQILARILPLNKTQRESAATFGRYIANFTILWIIAFVVAKNRELLAEAFRLGDIFRRDTGEFSPVSVTLRLFWLNLGGYTAGFVVGSLIGLETAKRRALTLEIGMQNAGLGALLAVDLFGPEAALPPALFTFGCMFSGTILANYWGRQGERVTGDKVNE
jgi:bile acid:Na+ symporter, BASS family